MKILRFVLILAVMGYAGWLAWPLLSPLLDGTGLSLDGPGLESGRPFGIPVAALWIGAAVLYLVAALMLGAGNPRAAVAYFLGFVADAVLRLAIDQGRSGAPDVAARSGKPGDFQAQDAGPMSLPGEVSSSLGIDPTWLVLGVLVLIGVLVFVASRRRRRVRIPGRLAA